MLGHERDNYELFRCVAQTKDLYRSGSSASLGLCRSAEMSACEDLNSSPAAHFSTGLRFQGLPLCRTTMIIDRRTTGSLALRHRLDNLVGQA